ncbi:MAG TPA: IPTL-CTERM sorting domain-containing protein [Desulfobacteraceae bacterium]|nr:IPTL-CTERM sorting domain-containing protein [Desulfobacteraceae bacterium]HPJ68267.1 IPTL-CTERM sorting domain-containing protein [Desulfobacteraceae bacterium]HPQ27940.1 IPTL-CTERM sorting domain-containing protein [Desulfobacteraceae bacterium]
MNIMPLVQIFRNLRLLFSVFTVLIICLPANSWSGVLEPNYFYEVLLDVDGSSGGNVTVKQLGKTTVKKSIDYKIRALSYLSDPLSGPSNAMVLGTQVLKWNETAFEIINTDSTSYPIGINTGKENSHTVEIALDLADLGNPNGIIRGLFHASNAEGLSDFSEDFQIDPGSDTAVPTLSEWGMIILAALIILLALATIKKGNQRLRRLTLIILAVISVAVIARATGFMLDGNVDDWSGIDPAITDTAGDSSTGDPWEDILYGFVQREGNMLYFRVDINPAVPQVPPEVTLSADPEAIEAGDSSTLTWTSANAISCIIGPGTGNVDLNGSVSVSPTETTTYSITATGPGGTAADSVTVIVNNSVDPLNVTITNPADGTGFAKSPIIVTGTLSRAGATVFVNGIRAVVVECNFMTENVPLNVGSNEIKALAEQGGEIAEDKITIFLTDIDLEPFQVQITSFNQDVQSLKVSGQVIVTVLNNGNGNVSVPYNLVLFEDADFSGAYEEEKDNFLAETSVDLGPGAGASQDVYLKFFGNLLFRDNLLHVFVDSQNDLDESNESNNLASAMPPGIDLSASLLRLDDTGCPDAITLAVRMGNSGGTHVSPGVSAAFYDGDPQSGGVLIGKAVSAMQLEPGQYEDLTLVCAGPSSGTRTIYACVDDDGSGASLLDETNEENNVASSDMSICPALPDQNSISGVVLDAVTGNFISGAVVTLYTEADGQPDIMIGQWTTGDKGDFKFSNLDPGSYILIGSANGYINGDRYSVLPSGQILTHQDIVLSPVLGPGETRIILTWGENPKDLEAHLTSPNPDGCRHHCFYWDKGIPGANLDLDDTDSFGPETITITQRASGTYRFYVHDFTNCKSSTSQGLSNSGALVKVYFGSGEPPAVFSVPAFPGTVWHVFDLDGDTGEVTPVNRMTFQDEPGKIDFPVITSSPVKTTTWGAPYTYQVEAVDPDLDMLSYTILKGPDGMSVDPFTGLIEWTPATGQGGKHGVEVQVSDGRCGDDTQEFYVNVNYMPIVNFTVEPCSGFNPGGDITLTWTTERADTVVIDQGIGEVSASGSLTIPSPDEPVAYTLTALNTAGEVQKTVPQKPTVSFWANPKQISEWESSTLTWDCRCAVTCRIDQGIGEVDLGGSMKVTPASLPAAYKLTATNGAGETSARLNFSVCTIPMVNISAKPVCEWVPGDAVTLSWSSYCADECEIDHGIGSVSLNGSMVVRPNEPTTYTISAMKTDYPFLTRDAIRIPVMKLTEVYFSAYPLYLKPGESSTLFWITECWDTCTIDQGIGEVAPNGSLRVTPDNLPATYKLTATNEHGSVCEDVTLYPLQSPNPSPIATFSASPAVLKIGQTATLTWTTENAFSCSILPGIGEVPLSGSVTFQPDKNTSYALVVTGPGGTITRYATVYFVRPAAQILADPATINCGGTSTLRWIFSNATRCFIDSGIGDVQLGGSINVSPQADTTYTITANGPGGTASDKVTVFVSKPTVQIQADPMTIDCGDSATLTWASNGADVCRIDQGIGDVGLNGSISVSPQSTTTYTITAADSCNAITDAVTVTVLYPPSIKITAPCTDNARANRSFTIKWTDADADDDADISIFYDSDGSGEDGTLIVAGLHEDPDSQGDEYIWDTSVLPEGTYYIYAVIDDGMHDPVVKYSDGTITIEHIPPSIEAKLNAGDASQYDQFGYAVSLSGDYAVVGTPYDDDNGYSSGAAYIFQRNGSAWLEQAKLTAHDASSYDDFGYSVSISGDYVIIGAYNDSSIGTSSGSAYVFKRDEDTWIEQAKLSAGDAAEGDCFGYSVSINGDYAIIGAPWKNYSYDEAGAVYIFKRDGSVWNEQAKLTASDAYKKDSFGYSVSINDDYAVVGAPYDDDGGEESGAAYIFKRDGDSWIEQAKLKAADAAPYLEFGESVSISGDYTLIGAPWASTAYIFKREDSVWIEKTKLTPGYEAEYNQFGCSVSLSSDYAMVGASRDDDAFDDSGAAYIFKRDGDSWNEKARIIASDAASGDYFGNSVCINGDYVIAGAKYDDEIGTSSGSAYIYAITNVEIEANPVGISIGDSSTLSWNSVHADFCNIEPGIGSVDPSGSIEVWPAVSTTYTITASGPVIMAENFVSVIVADPSMPPAVNMSADPETIYSGQSSILSWDTSNALSCVIEPDIGEIDLSGSINVSPTQDTTYTITASNAGGSITDRVTVRVEPYPKPTVSISAAPEAIQNGDSTILSWTTAFAYTCEIDQGIGAVDVEGTIQISPAETTTYIITAKGPGGASSSSVTVTVTGPPTIEIIEPDAPNDAADAGFTIKWTDTAPEADAQISLFYDTDDTGEDGTLIVSGLREDPDGQIGDLYAWDTGQVSEGIYYVYAVIDDGIHEPVVDYSCCPVTILHTIPDEFKITATDAQENDGFGYSVSISGDYAVIGTYTDHYRMWADSAYIFKREGAVWVEQEKLTPGDAEKDNNFGCSVCISGDCAIIGADNSKDGTGAAYIFMRDGSEWNEQAKITASDGYSNGYSGDTFGNSVSISGDYAIVGAYAKDDGGPYTGASYIFKSDGSAWTEQTKLTANDAADYDQFGYSVSICGDYAIVGAIGDDDGGNYSGSAYIFKRDGSEWTEQAKITASDAASSDNFGYSVSLSGDYAIVGAYSDDDAGNSSGSAYIFKRDGSEWTEQAKITASDAASSDNFGYSVSLSGNYAVVGAYRDDSWAGSAYIFKRDGSVWTEQTKLTASDAEQYDNFGYSVSISGGYAVIGAPYNDDDGDYSGSAYIYPVLGGDLPTVSLSASPDIILAGDSSTLSWSSTNADSVSIDQGIGNVDVNGSITVSPVETTTYTITATGNGGTATQSVTVTVTYPLPSVILTADLDAIVFGESSALSWSSTNADSVSIDQGIGSVDVNGSITVSPAETTTYTITAAGPGGTATQSVTVTVTYPLPTVSISASPEIIQTGESSTLSWTSTHAASCVITPDIGNVDLNGSVLVSPTQMTTYTITATSPGGTSRAYARVYVENGPVYDYGDPTPAEQAHLEAINRARLNPAAEAARLGIDLNEGLTDGTISDAPVQPLTFNAGLLRAAYLHSKDMIINQYYSHDSLDGKAPSDRIQEAGYQYLAYGENIAYIGSNAPLDEYETILGFHDALFLDEGVEGRGHRISILNGEYKEAGLGAVYGSFDEYPCSAIFTCDFGTSSVMPTSFLLGVVYDDQNNDGIYTAGEGIGNAEIVIAESGSGTLTASAGGYALPIAPGHYTIKATLPDNREATREFTMADQNVKVDFLENEFNFPPPAVVISADPEAVEAGSSSTLTWSSTNADSVTIDQGIGNVVVNGSVSVSPSASTTYTITATGPGGTAVNRITVRVYDPARPISVSISADPQSIEAGESLTLTWTSANATSCVIEPDIGNVEMNGSASVSPKETTTYTITASNPSDTATSSVTVTVASPISLVITAPSDDDTLSVPYVMVIGTVSNDNGSETGVIVNGVSAVVTGGQLVTNHVPLQRGENTITVNARDTNGFIASASVTVNAAIAEDYIKLTPDSESGTAPFETTLTVERSFTFTSPAITYTGPGVVEFSDNPNENEYTVKMTTPGIYYFTASAQDDQNSTYTDTIAVQVLDKTELDVLLRAKWEGMKAALANQDIQSALEYFHEGSKEKYEEIFNLLIDRLSDISSAMREIEFVSSKDKMAKFRIKREEEIQGQTYDITYHIYFVKDLYGLWGIESF